MALYKIRNKETGEYSTGGQSPDWTKLGKTWNSLGTLKSHFTMINNQYKYINQRGGLYGLNAFLDVYKNCEVVELEIKEGMAMDIDEFVKSKI